MGRKMSGLGKLIAVAGAAAGGYMQGQRLKEEKEERESERAWRDEQRAQQRDEWERQKKIREANSEAAQFLADRIGAGGRQERAPAIPGQAEAPQMSEDPNAPSLRRQVSGDSPQMTPAPEGALRKPPDERATLAFAAFNPGPMSDPETLKGLVDIYGRRGMGEEASKWMLAVQKAQRENAFPALIALSQGDANSAREAFSRSGQMKLADDPKALTQIDDKGNWRATLADGRTHDFNPKTMLMSLLSPEQYFAEMKRREDADIKTRELGMKEKYYGALTRAADSRADKDDRTTPGGKKAVDQTKIGDAAEKAVKNITFGRDPYGDPMDTKSTDGFLKNKVLGMTHDTLADAEGQGMQVRPHQVANKAYQFAQKADAKVRAAANAQAEKLFDKKGRISDDGRRQLEAAGYAGIEDRNDFLRAYRERNFDAAVQTMISGGRAEKPAAEPDKPAQPAAAPKKDDGASLRRTAPPGVSANNPTPAGAVAHQSMLEREAANTRRREQLESQIGDLESKAGRMSPVARETWLQNRNYEALKAELAGLSR